MSRRLQRFAVGSNASPPIGALTLLPDAVSSLVSTATIQVDVLANDSAVAAGGIRLTAVQPALPLPAANVAITGDEPNQKIAVNLAGLGAGVYTAVYSAALISNPGIQSSATLTVSVIEEPALDAVDDPVGALLGAGGLDVDVLANDTGTGPLKITKVTAAGALPQANLSITGSAPDQKVHVSFAGLAAGSYSFSYEIQLVGGPGTLSDTATATLTLTANDFVTAVDDTQSMGTSNAGFEIPVLANDTGSGPLRIASVTPVAPLVASNLSIVGTVPNQRVRVARAGLVAGSYSFSYRLELDDDPAVFDTATVAVTVFQVNSVTAVDDTQRMASSTAGFEVDVLANDLGSGDLRIASVTSKSSSLPQASLSITGTVPNQTVRVDRGGLSAGDYTFEYRVELASDATVFDTGSCTCTVFTVDTSRKIFNMPKTDRIFLCHRDLTGTSEPFAAHAAKITRVWYFPGKSWPYPSGGYDHSDAGIKAYAKAIWDFIDKNADTGLRIMWQDWEETNQSYRTSRNVPADVGYDKTKESWHAGFYDVSVPAGFSNPPYPGFPVTKAKANTLRVEAGRYARETFKEVQRLARAAGMGDFEQYSYTNPDRPNDNDSSWTLEATQTKDWYDESMMGGGVPMYFQGSKATQTANQGNPGHWTGGFKQDVKDMRAAYGANFKILPTIWARWWNNKVSGSGQNLASNYLNGDFCVPEGFMAAAFTACMDAGADGVTLFASKNDGTGSGSPSDPDLAKRYKARHKEVADLLGADSRFVSYT